MPTFPEIVPRGLIVSCQAAKGDPLYGEQFMAHMAVAAQQGGAIAIRANGRADIRAIRAATSLPIVGISKTAYATSPITITPTFEEAAEVVAAGAAVVALDATSRRRPRGETLDTLIRRIHAELGVPVVADVSTCEEGVHAAQIGADAVATTLAGHVDGSRRTEGPDLQLVKDLVGSVRVPVIAEGRYESPTEARAAFELGAYAIVVGTAITRPQVITQRFVAAIPQGRDQRA